ncbi:MAG TPA: ABC transporter ATP-binding protein [Candidatus Acidoferrum sp.]|nr:ABC transporter ATP-binding protein [Candidatus Acidoferrum sp.]
MTAELQVDKLSKQYSLGLRHRPNTATEMFLDSCRSLFSRRPASDNMIWALQNVSFAVSPGEVVGIIGRNGAGKSTLLKLLARITHPTSGILRVNGRIASLLEVGTGFHEELTGRENIYLSGSILGMPKARIDARLASIIEFAGLERFIDTPIKRYSTGMRLRLGFAVAAHLESDILLVDEVLAVGDVEFQKKCLERMGDMHAGGRTVLFVSHNLAAVAQLCKRVIWIDNGRLRLDGSASEVIEAYLTTFASQQTDNNLRACDSRTGSGDVRYTHLEYLTLDRAPVGVLRSGDPLVVRLHFEAKRPLEYPIFGLDIYTPLGTLAAQMHTYNSGFDTPLLPAGPGYVDLEIGELNLMPGRYTLSLLLAQVHYVFHDVVQHCASLEVEPSPRYGLNRGITGHPVMCLPCRWSLEFQSAELARAHVA